MSVTVFRAGLARERPRGPGVKTSQLVTHELSGTTFLNGITTFDPGAELPYHSHNCAESVMVLSGRAMCETLDEGWELTASDVTWIPAGVVHRFRNVSGEHAMRILWTYGSPDASRTIAATGETTQVEFEANP
jgi:quercetin dioxygenase-like cupin family protein